MEENKFNQAYKIALRYLSFQMKTAFQVEEYLLRKKYSKEVAQQVVKQLINQKYLNDEFFCQVYGNEKLKREGRNKIRLSLLKKGVSKEIVETYIKTISEEDELKKALEIGQRRVYFYRYLPPQSMRRKLMNFLLRRGFSLEIVEKVIKEILSQPPSE